MYNHNKAQQSKNRVYISWDILYNTMVLDCVIMEPIWIRNKQILIFTNKKLWNLHIYINIIECTDNSAKIKWITYIIIHVWVTEITAVSWNNRQRVKYMYNIYIHIHAVHSRYLMVYFIQRTQKRRPVACPKELSMGCLSSDHSVDKILAFLHLHCVQCHVVHIRLQYIESL